MCGSVCLRLITAIYHRQSITTSGSTLLRWSSIVATTVKMSSSCPLDVSVNGIPKARMTILAEDWVDSLALTSSPSHANATCNSHKAPSRNQSPDTTRPAVIHMPPHSPYSGSHAPSRAEPDIQTLPLPSQTSEPGNNGAHSAILWRPAGQTLASKATCSQLSLANLQSVDVAQLGADS